jgi:hypothetical protein
MPDRVDLIYLQQGDRIAILPPAYPAMRRRISFRPSSAEKEAGAEFQAIDGSFTGGGCASLTPP